MFLNSWVSQVFIDWVSLLFEWTLFFPSPKHWNVVSFNHCCSTHIEIHYCLHNWITLHSKTKPDLLHMFYISLSKLALWLESWASGQPVSQISNILDVAILKKKSCWIRIHFLYFNFKEEMLIVESDWWRQISMFYLWVKKWQMYPSLVSWVTLRIFCISLIQHHWVVKRPTPCAELYFSDHCVFWIDGSFAPESSNGYLVPMWYIDVSG